ncbi:MAG: hypothetical protein ACU4EQ_10420 [Candidatus Nitrosoglobus sp.]
MISVPFIDQGWQGVSNINSGLYQAATNPAQETKGGEGVFDWKDLSSHYKVSSCFK